MYIGLMMFGGQTDRQTEIHTAERLVPEPSAFEIEMATEKQKDTNHQILIKYQKN